MEDIMIDEKKMLFQGDEEYKTFVEETATEVLKVLSSDDKAYMKEHTDPFEYHFSLGLAIRNSYIHGNEKYSFLMPDDVSGDIIKAIIDKLSEGK